MSTYLINYTLWVYQYMQPTPYKEPKMIIVEAESSELAQQTLIKYWDNKSDQYGTSYTAHDIDVIETIKQIDLIK